MPWKPHDLEGWARALAAERIVIDGTGMGTVRRPFAKRFSPQSSAGKEN